MCVNQKIVFLFVFRNDSWERIIDEYSIFNKKIQRFLLGCIAVIFVMAISLEILSAIAIESHIISYETPNYQTPVLRPFWVDENRHFFTWHAAN